MPADVSPAPVSASPFAGTWIGAWGGFLKTILVVESISQGQAKVVYAIADNPGWFKREWSRYDAKITGKTLTISRKLSKIKFTLDSRGWLRAVYREGAAFGILARMDLNRLIEPEATIPWTLGTSEYLVTDLIEDNKPIALESVIFKPPGKGPFPLVVVNHGSTGDGKKAAAAGQTWADPWFADFLNEKGWMVAFPQRQGRGKSGGTYDEGLAEDRTQGYACNTERSLAGAERALEGIHAAIVALRERPDVAEGPVLLAGVSRGGILSIAYAGKYPDKILGVINFVGGWVGDGCSVASTINQTLFNKGSAFKGDTLWVYGRNDSYYSMAHSRQNFEEFRKHGGQGQFAELTVPSGNNGHHVMSLPPLWSKVVSSYLDRHSPPLQPVEHDFKSNER